MRRRRRWPSAAENNRALSGHRNLVITRAVIVLFTTNIQLTIAPVWSIHDDRSGAVARKISVNVNGSGCDSCSERILLKIPLHKKIFRSRNGAA